ncbi:MAG: 5-(carboxyamino)imidazole ribonucleotide mutase [Gammaproteobacteria bacterium]|nr:5-(carboxyamino)imidazole ribonucleotide mutase [Gammaproteobacteria bacterium]
MGSDSDLPVMESTFDVLDELGVSWEAHVTSAHRTPERTHEIVKSAEERGCAVFISAAGLAAHLGGVVASLTVRPVIGVPMEGGPLNGHDALLSTVKMPGGIPVAIGKAGAKNAGFLAAQIIGVANPDIAKNVRDQREKSVREIADKDQALQQEIDRR